MKLLTTAFFFLLPLLAQKQELGLMLGGVLKQDRTAGSTKIELGSGMSLHANYAYRLAGNDAVGLYGGVNFIANPLRDITTLNRSVIRDVATIYATPELKVKWRPGGRISPFAFGGGGWAVYEHSREIQSGASNPGDRLRTTSTLTYGGGVDARLFRFLGARGEIRDNYSGAPQYGAGLTPGRQHNVTVAGGLTLRWGH
jgi:opacity protein-like surface antigen